MLTVNEVAFWIIVIIFLLILLCYVDYRSYQFLEKMQYKAKFKRHMEFLEEYDGD